MRLFTEDEYKTYYLELATWLSERTGYLSLNEPSSLSHTLQYSAWLPINRKKFSTSVYDEFIGEDTAL